jgi:AraC-like DNA-binding protein
MKLYIKYMVSLRCKLVVKAALEDLGLHYKYINLGEVEINEELSPETWQALKEKLQVSGLELMEDKKSILIEKIKNIVVELIHYSEENVKYNFSTYISEKLNHDYTYLSNLFSQVTGSTLEHFIIAHKIEKVKELLLYDELNLTEIAYKLHYSSVSHLSFQFKKVTGLTPSYFKKIKAYRQRIQLENV